MTNFEKLISLLTVEHLAIYITLNTGCPSCPANGEICDGNSRSCTATIEEWLRKEAK